MSAKFIQGKIGCRYVILSNEIIENGRRIEDGNPSHKWYNVTNYTELGMKILDVQDMSVDILNRSEIEAIKAKEPSIHIDGIKFDSNNIVKSIENRTMYQVNFLPYGIIMNTPVSVYGYYYTKIMIQLYYQGRLYTYTTPECSNDYYFAITNFVCFSSNEYSVESSIFNRLLPNNYFKAFITFNIGSDGRLNLIQPMELNPYFGIIE